MKHFLSFSFLTAIILGTVALSSCKKEITQNPIQQNIPPAHFLKGFLGDEEIIIQSNTSYFTDVSNLNDADGDDDNNSNNPDADDDQSTLITGCKWTSTNELGSTITGSVELRKEVFRIYVTPFMNNQYYGMLAPGTYNFAYQNNSSSGVYITVRDKSGKVWTSKGEQTGSSFHITYRSAKKEMFATITGTVSCKMYDSYGNMKMFTGGSFIANNGL